MKKLAIGFLFDDTLDNDAGVAQYVKVLGPWLSKRGHKVSYIVGETKLKNWGGGKVYSLAKNLPVVFNGNHLSIPLPTSTGKVKSLLSRNTFDVLHVQMPHSPFMSGRVLSHSSDKTAVVGTFHIFPSGWLSKVGSRLLKLSYLGSLKNIDEVVSVSNPAADFAKSAFGLKTSVIPNAVSLDSLRPSGSSRTVPNKVVFLGRLVERKGCLELLKAFELVAKWHPKARLVIAGDGPQRKQLKKFVRSRQMDSSVEFLGYINEGDKPALLASASIACFPSLYGESFGIVLIEAMAAGAGVVLGGDNPGYVSVIGEQPELLINPGDTEAFARKLQLMLTDQALRKKLHKWQQEHVKQFDIDIVGPQVEKLYYQNVSKKGGTI